MTPLDEHQLLVFWVQLAVLLVTARALGGLFRRLGQPAVVGELTAGLLLGPTVLGRVAPGVESWLFPDGDAVQSGLLLAVAWVGIALLLVTTGFETDLALLRRLGRPALNVAAGSLVVPLAASFAMGLAVPALFYGEAADSLTFALFLAVAMSISALAIVGRILVDLRLMRRDVGQVMIGATVANDLTGWLLLGVITGIVTAGGFDPVGLLVTILSIGAFLGLALTAGQRLVDQALRRARQGQRGMLRPFTVMVAAALAAGAVTQAIGVEAVFGAFVAGIVIGRSRYQHAGMADALETVTHAFFAPLFFATAGLFVDLWQLADARTALWTAGIVAVAFAVKFAGAFAGARLGGLGPLASVSTGIGLNARGTLEIVAATIGLGLGVFNAASYAAVVVLAMATSIAVPPLLRLALTRLGTPPEEAARLEREEMMARSVVASTRQALLPTRGGENSILAGRILDLALQPEGTVTIYTVNAADDREGRSRAEEAAAELESALHESRRVDHIARTADDVTEAICTESGLGYGLVALGMTEAGAGGATHSPVLDGLLSHCPVPMLLVRHGGDRDAHAEPRFRRLLVPATGTRADQAAQEAAFTLGARVGAPVDVVHVVDRPDHRPVRVWVDGRRQLIGPVAGILAEAEERAQKFGSDVRTSVRIGEVAGRELAEAATEAGVEAIVLGAQVRSYDGRPFLGHGVEYVLEHAPQTVIVVVLPAAAQQPQPEGAG